MIDIWTRRRYTLIDIWLPTNPPHRGEDIIFDLCEASRLRVERSKKLLSWDCGDGMICRWISIVSCHIAIPCVCLVAAIFSAGTTSRMVHMSKMFGRDLRILLISPDTKKPDTRVFKIGVLNPRFTKSVTGKRKVGMVDTGKPKTIEAPSFLFGALFQATVLIGKRVNHKRCCPIMCQFVDLSTQLQR